MPPWSRGSTFLAESERTSHRFGVEVFRRRLVTEVGKSDGLVGVFVGGELGVNNLGTYEVVYQLGRVDVLQCVIAHYRLRKVAESVQSFFVHFIVLVLDGETLGVGHASGIYQLHLNFAELLVIGCGIYTEHISSFGNESKTTRHRDSCHCNLPPKISCVCFCCQ